MVMYAVWEISLRHRQNNSEYFHFLISILCSHPVQHVVKDVCVAGRDSNSLLTAHAIYPWPSFLRPHLLRGVLLLRPRNERRVAVSAAAALA